MIIIIGTILLIIIGIILVIIGNNASVWDDAPFLLIGGMLILIFGLILLVELGLLITKKYQYRDFKVEYENIKETLTSKDDIRDAHFTEKIININENIRWCKEYKNDKVIGIFVVEEICNFKLLNKGE